MFVTPYGYLRFKARALDGRQISVSHHRTVVEQSIGRKLLLSEDIHHIDGNKQNNAIENLAVLSRAEHKRIHAGWKKLNGKWIKPCCVCRAFLPCSEFYTDRVKEFSSTCKRCHCRVMTKKQQDRKVRGLCVTCGKPRNVSATHCDYHFEKRRRQGQLKRKKNK